MRALGPKQRLVLHALTLEWAMPPTAREVAIEIQDPIDLRPVADAENAANTLRSLERRGLARRVGRGGHTWQITEAGRRIAEVLEP